MLLNSGSGSRRMAAPNKYIPSKNQVAGHRFEEGRVGSLVDGSGLFFKPLQGDERGEREVAFYERFWQDESVPAGIKHFFPKFYGVKELEADGPVGKLKHAALEDLTHAYKNPSIVDIKMGKQTWYPGCSGEYERKCRAKDATTPSPELGLRVSGMQICDPRTGETWRADRQWGKSLDAQGTAGALKRFVLPFDDEVSRRNATTRIHDLLAQLKDFQQWFETQGTYHFYSASLLLMYDSTSSDEPSTSSTQPKAQQSQSPEADTSKEGASAFPQRSPLEVRLIDFAHVVDGKGKPDSNFLFGLRKLVEVYDRLLSEIESKN